MVVLNKLGLMSELGVALIAITGYGNLLIIGNALENHQ